MRNSLFISRLDHKSKVAYTKQGISSWLEIFHHALTTGVSIETDMVSGLSLVVLGYVRTSLSFLIFRVQTECKFSVPDSDYLRAKPQRF